MSLVRVAPKTENGDKNRPARSGCKREKPKRSTEPKSEAWKIQARTPTGKPKPRTEIRAARTEEPKRAHRTRQEQ
jgi:hypothetical protein